MNIKTVLLLLALGMTLPAFQADTLLVETFDDTQGYSANSFSDGTSDYFDRWHDTLSLNHDFTDAHGVNYFVAEDTDSPDNPLGAGALGYLVMDNVTVTGFDRLEVIVALAATDGESPSEAQFERNQFELDDSLVIEYALDGNIASTLTDGTYTRLSGFTGFEDIDNAIYSYPLTEDKNGDGTFDGVTLSSAFQDVKYPLSISGDLFSLRIRVDVDGLDDVGIDNIRIVGISNASPVINVPDTIHISTQSVYSYGFSITDPDGDDLTIEYLDVPAQGFTFRNDSVFIDPLTMVGTEDTITISASDGDSTTSQEVVFIQSDRSQDSLALLAIWDSLGQPSWENWGSAEPIDMWAGLYIENDRVTQWNNHNFAEATGPLAPEVAYLTALERIYSRSCQLTSLPQEMSNMPNLLYITLWSDSAITWPEDSLVFPSLLEFDIRNTTVSKLPIAFDQSPNLDRVIVYYADIDSLPESLRECKSLTYLGLIETGLSHIQDWIGELTQLERLNLYTNDLTEIPATFANLINLKSFDLDDNQLSSFDFDLTDFYQLDYFYLSTNLFTEVPEGIRNAPVLTYIGMYENQITSVPFWLFEKKYEEIDFSYNRITALPDSIIYLDSFFIVDIYNNEITLLPEGLGLNTVEWGEFDLSSNRITALPESFSSVQNMTSSFNLSNNEIHYDDIERMVDVINNAKHLWNIFNDQKNVGDMDTVWVVIGDTVTLNHNVRGTTSKIHFKWESGQQGELSTSYDMDSAYTIKNVMLADTGFYVVHMKNDSTNSSKVSSDTIWVKLNEAPVITSDTTVAATEDVQFSYVGTATNDNGTVQLSYISLPNWLSVQGDSVVGTPIDGDGDTSFTVIASDGVLDDSLVVTVLVTDVPDTTTNVTEKTISTLIKTDSVEVTTEYSGETGKEDTVITTTTFDLYLDSAVTITDSLEDGVWYGADTVVNSETYRRANQVEEVDERPYQSTLTTNVTEKTVSTLIKTDSVEITTEYSGETGKEDTVITTVTFDLYLDSAVTITDSLEDGVWYSADTVVNSETYRRANEVEEVDERPYQPTLSTNVTEKTISTLITADSVDVTTEYSGETGKEDTVITTTTFDLYLDSAVTITDSLKDGVWYGADTVVNSETYRRANEVEEVDERPYQSTLSTNVTEKTISTLITADSVEVTTEYTGEMGKEDTVITTTTFDLYLDSAVTITDSLEDGVLYSADTVVTAVEYRKEITSEESDTLFWGVTAIVDGLGGSDMADLSVYPNPVPLSDQDVRVTLPADRAGFWSIVIFDALGNVITKTELETVGESTFTWNLKNRYGIPVAGGTYLLIAHYRDSAGKVWVSKKSIGVQR